MNGAWTTIGRVVSVNVVKREVRIRLIAPETGIVDESMPLRFMPGGGKPIRCQAAAIRRIGGTAVAVLGPGVPKEMVAAFKGAEVAVPAGKAAMPRTELPSVEELTGMTVAGESGEIVGAVTGAFRTPAHAVIQVRQRDGSTFLFPVVAEAIAGVDLERGVLTVRELAPYAVYDED